MKEQIKSMIEDVVGRAVKESRKLKNYQLIILEL